MADETHARDQAASLNAGGDQAGVLAYSQILHRLKSGDIFKQGTWEESCIRAAGYDLRIADDFMIIAGDVDSDPLVYDVGVKREKMIVLKPGQLAIVSTAENIRMPWDLAGQIGVKSSVARRGVLILGGGFVDPGFGLAHSDERLHFILMNISGSDVYLTPGKEKFVSLQVSLVRGSVPQEIKARPVRGMDDAKRVHFQTAPGVKPGEDLSLGFFTELSKLRNEVHTLESRLDGFGVKLADLQSGILPLTTFGITIWGVVFLGVVFTSLMDLAAKEPIIARVKILSDASGGGVGILGLAVVAVGLTWFVGRLLNWVGQRIGQAWLKGTK